MPGRWTKPIHPQANQRRSGRSLYRRGCRATRHLQTAPTVIYRHAIAAHSYVFQDLRDLLAKATPLRSGDRLAGVAADTAEEMIAARMALADVPLKQFLQETVVPYEDDDVTRLIIDSHDAPAFA